eukprot:scaffold201785_cov29-Tisochrysis_lutea.AAC.1
MQAEYDTTTSSRVFIAMPCLYQISHNPHARTAPKNDANNGHSTSWHVGSQPHMRLHATYTIHRRPRHDSAGFRLRLDAGQGAIPLLFRLSIDVLSRHHDRKVSPL